MNRVFISLLSLITLVIPSNAQIIKNGGFESNTLSQNRGFTVIKKGRKTLKHWKVVKGEIDLVDNYWSAFSGGYSIDLNGYSSGTITQNIRTVPGATYYVSFQLSGNPECGDSIRSLMVSAGNHQSEYGINILGTSRHALQWRKQSFRFTAIDSFTTLTFSSLEENNCGAILDDIKVLVDCACLTCDHRDSCFDGFSVHLPSQFSPDGDGLDDVFSISGNPDGILRIVEFTLFNSWGVQLVKLENQDVVSDLSLWDGTHNGTEQNSGAYSFTLELQLINGQTITRTGIVHLLR
ncbi:MAG: choice-of-anchor C family protein [Bacteroidia bacterium]|nr:choice-of-anchor C family protein [Bacteroidia bacterium]